MRRADCEAEPFERARARAAAALREGARVVCLTPPPGCGAEHLLRASVSDAGGCLVQAGALDLDTLACRILEALGAPALSDPTGVLRAYAAHLRCRGRRLVVGIGRPEDLPQRTLGELALLLRSLRGSLQLVVEGREGESISWAALGVEPTRVTGSAAPRAGAGATRRRPFALAVGTGLAAALAAILLAAPGPREDPVAQPAALARPDPAPREAESLDTAAEAEPPVARLPRDHAGDDASDAVRSGRRALAALANARSDAEWKEGTRILDEIGPQPALMAALEELGSRPGCVRKRSCVSTRARLQAALCTAWADEVERGEVPAGLRCS